MSCMFEGVGGIWDLFWRRWELIVF